MKQYSYSQVRNFLSCEEKWYIDKVMGIRAVEVKRPPTMGSAIHLAIAARINQNDVTKVLDQYIDEKEKEIVTLFPDLPYLEEEWVPIKASIKKDVPWIVDAWTKWIELDNWETVVHGTFGPLVERKLVHVEPEWGSLPEFEFIWIADWVATDKRTGLTWLIDWKARSQFMDDRHHEFNLQKMVYQFLLTIDLDLHVSGSRVAQIKPTSPATPKQNKNGDMSRAACATTWDRYREALLDAGLDPNDYLDMKEKLASPNDWFEWQSAYRTDHECQAAWEQIILPAILRMEQLRKTGDPVRNLGSLDCTRMCSYKLICMETLRGRSVEGLLDFGFVKKTDKVEEEIIEDGVQDQ